MQLKTLFQLTLCASTLFGFTACDDDDTVIDPVIDPVEPGLTTDITAEGYYKGDFYDAGTGNLFINFISTSLRWDDMDEDYTGTGDIVCLDFNTVLAANPDFATLADGTYTADTDGSHAEYTINIDEEDSYVVKYTNSASADYLITSGSLTVTSADGITAIEGNLTLDDQSTYIFRYVGSLSIINRTGEGNMSNLTQNVTVSDLTQGVAMYFGQTFTETSDLYMVVLAGADYDLDENFGNAPSIWLGLNVTPGSTTGIPSGTYTLIDAMEADDYPVGSALSGVYEESLGGFFGSWYFCTADGLEASMQTGTAKVTNNGDGTYAITFTMADGYGHTVSGSFNGALPVEDLSE